MAVTSSVLAVVVAVEWEVRTFSVPELAFIAIGTLKFAALTELWSNAEFETVMGTLIGLLGAGVAVAFTVNSVPSLTAVSSISRVMPGFALLTIQT